MPSSKLQQEKEEISLNSDDEEIVS